MTIKDAKTQIKNAMTAYFTKNEYGDYVIPIEKQRPLFLMGPPGIGKTAVMEQVASELNVGLVSYSMTHHTRQSALGLPFIETKTYGGKEYSFSEYTMSEIIASVYDMIESTGHKEGILFLDEINCVSETLAPSMLQFLQYKIFGRHRVPDGWIVVTAGNPPEYNNSVREFDIVTWDRLKRIDVEPDYEVWKEYAYRKATHPAILTYLDIKQRDFYKIESTVDGKSFVTARGWSDLSDMMRLYEQHNLPVDAALIEQYLQNKRIARDFANYYDLFNKYRSDYQVDKILDGKAGQDIKDRAANAKFDERLALIGLMLDCVTEQTRSIAAEEAATKELLGAMKAVFMLKAKPNADVAAELDRQSAIRRESLERGRKASSLSDDDKYALNGAIKALEEMKMEYVKEAPDDAFTFLKALYDKRPKELSAHAKEVGKMLSNVFGFCDEVFGEGQEILIFVTELTVNAYTARFISRYGCKEYFEHNRELLFYERQKEIIEKIDNLELDEQ